MLSAECTGWWEAFLADVEMSSFSETCFISVFEMETKLFLKKKVLVHVRELQKFLIICFRFI